VTGVTHDWREMASIAVTREKDATFARGGKDRQMLLE
jgi:hypothetical protein